MIVFRSWLRFLLLSAVLQAGQTRADDWPQWLGTHRDSLWREDGILPAIPSGGLQVKWRVPLSGGYAGPAVANQRVYVMDYVVDSGDQTPNPDERNALQGTERVLCLDADTGATVWMHQYACPYEISYAAGPRATPTVHAGRVYTLGAEGNLCCLDATSGKLIWERQFKRDFGAKTPIWGFCGHPLVDGDVLICIVGGSGSAVVAFDLATGEERWRSLETDEIGYSTPAIVEHGGKRQLLIWLAKSLNSLDPATGTVYWTEPLDPNYGMSIVTPRLSGDLLFVGGIVNKSLMMRLDPQQPGAQVQWRGTADIGLDPVFSTPYLEEGHLYGVSREGKLSAIKLDDGHVLWSHFDLMPDKRRAQSGTVFLVKHEDRFFLMTDSGELAIARLTPEGYTELGRTKILEPTGAAMGRTVVWSHPAFANRCIYARNDQEIICVSLAAADYGN